jgi:hypothetical protein
VEQCQFLRVSLCTLPLSLPFLVWYSTLANDTYLTSNLTLALTGIVSGSTTAA